MTTAVRGGWAGLVAALAWLTWATAAGCTGDGEEPFGGGVGASNVGGSVGLGGTGAGASGGSVGLGGTGAGASGGSVGLGGTGAGGSLGGTGGTGASGGTGAAGNGGEAGAGGQCELEVHPVAPVPLDLVLLLDRSGSMQDENKWSALAWATQAFLSDPASSGIGAAVQYIPVMPSATIPTSCTSDPDCGLYGPCEALFYQCTGAYSTDSSCDPADYDPPDVGIGPLPATQAALSASIAGQSADGSSTPGQPALEGIMSYATSWAASHVGHVTAIVLATDGEPTNCTYNTLEGMATAAAIGQAAVPPVRTHVIGIGSMLTTLDPIAAAGGTGEARIVAPGAQQPLLHALEDIRDSVHCTYPIPAPDQGPILYDYVNVLVSEPNDPPNTDTLANVATLAACSPSTGGWFYDPSATPHVIVLCPASCSDVGGSSLVVSVAHGCPTLH